MRPELNLNNKSQMSKPNEYTDNFKSNLICIFPSVRAKLKNPLCPRTLCSNSYALCTRLLLPFGNLFDILNLKIATLLT